MPNNVEVSKAFKRFLILLLISIAAGKLFRAAVQDVLDNRWSYFSRSLKEKGIYASSPQIVFSRFGVPTVGAVIESLTYETQVKCFEYKISAEQLFLPLRISKLFLFKVEFGTLRIDKTRFSFRESTDCDSNEAFSQTLGEKNSESPFQEVEALKIDNEIQSSVAWLDSLSKWFVVHHARLGRMPIRSFYLQTVEVFGENLKEKKVSGVGSMTVDLNKDVQAQLVFEKLVLGKTSRSVTTEFRAQVEANEQKIQLRGDWAYYEGHLTADFQFDRDENVRLDLRSTDLPLSVLNRWFDTPWTFQFLWFHCGLQITTTKKNWSQAPWNLEGCLITGPYGAVSFEGEKTNSLKQFDHLQINFKDIQMDRVLNGKDQFPLSGIVKDYGVVNGQMDVRQNTIEGQWSLKDTSVIFSKKNKRHLQAIDQLKGRFEYKKGIAVIELDSAQIKKGIFEGLVRFVYDKYKNLIQSTSQIRKLNFSPEIQELLLGGAISPISLEGDLVMEGQAPIRQGQLKAKAESFSSLNVSAQNLIGLLGWQDSAPQLALSAEKITVEKGDNHHWIFASLLHESVSLRRIDFQQVYAKMVKADSQKTLMIEKATALVPGVGRFAMKGKASWEEGQGQAQWQFSKGSSLDWEWTYRGQEATWIPQNKEMRDWLLSHEDWHSEYPFIR
jgi:hypothetical protein